MQHLPRTGSGVLVVILASLFLSACAAGACGGKRCADQMALLEAAVEANAAAIEATGQAAAANSAAIAGNSDGDMELRRMAERAMAMAEQNRAAIRTLSEKVDRMFATMSRK